MAIYAIGDLHLSFAVNKPMDIFGTAWENHIEKLNQGFEKVADDDLVILAGDSSWAMSMNEAVPDFSFINDLPGKKLILKGNHDYWWETVSKIKKCFSENQIDSIDVLHNNAFMHGDTAICGTRGWFLDQDGKDGKVYKRELGRLEASLKAGRELGAKRLVCALHYPPIYEGYECEEITNMLSEYEVELCVYGHLHGPSHRLAYCEEKNGVKYQLISADYLKFEPLLL